MKQPTTLAARNYGDLVNAGILGLGCLGLLHEKVLELRGELGRPPRPCFAICVSLHIWVVVFGSVSFFQNRKVFSILASLGCIVLLTLMNVYNFQQYSKSSLLPEFVCIYLSIAANMRLPCAWKAFLGILTLLAGLFSVAHSTLPVEPHANEILFSCMGLYLAINYYWHRGTTDRIATHGARAIMVASFCYEIASEVQALLNAPAYDANVGTYKLATVAFYAMVGLASVGVFSSNIEEKNRLEVLVEERTREILRQQDELYLVGLASQASETAIAITDLNQNVMWSNPALERLLAKRPQNNKDVGKKTIVEQLNLDADDRRRIISSFQTTDSARNVEVTIGESEYDMEISRFGGTDTKGQTLPIVSTRFVVALKDVTERKRREQAEEAALREVMMTKAMTKSMEVLTHELRTPLRIMGITSMLVKDDNLPKDALDSLELVMASSSLLLVLINNLLDIRKCSANMMDEFVLEPIPSASPIRDAADFCRPLAAISNVQIKVEYGDAEHAMVLAESLRLQQVMINLLSNGIKYTVEGSIIRVVSRIATVGAVHDEIQRAAVTGATLSSDLDNEQKVLIIEVTDSGPGIPTSRNRLLFRKFAQLDNKDKGKTLGGNTAGQPQGTGLGLNLCLTFVELMKGAIWASNNASGIGASFSFCLPFVSNDSPTKESRSSNETSGGVAGLENGAASSPCAAALYSVLVVDDILINRKVVDRMLRRIGVRTVKTVESGREALEELEKTEYDLVISDIQMPEMNGMELSQSIQSSKCLRKRPVVIGLTADASQAVEDSCLASGMVDVIHKVREISFL